MPRLMRITNQDRTEDTLTGFRCSSRSSVAKRPSLFYSASFEDTSKPPVVLELRCSSALPLERILPGQDYEIVLRRKVSQEPAPIGSSPGYEPSSRTGAEALQELAGAGGSGPTEPSAEGVSPTDPSPSSEKASAASSSNDTSGSRELPGHPGRTALLALIEEWKHRADDFRSPHADSRLAGTSSANAISARELSEVVEKFFPEDDPMVDLARQLQATTREQAAIMTNAHRLLNGVAADPARPGYALTLLEKDCRLAWNRLQELERNEASQAGEIRRLKAELEDVRGRSPLERYKRALSAWVSSEDPTSEIYAELEESWALLSPEQQIELDGIKIPTRFDAPPLVRMRCIRVDASEGSTRIDLHPIPREPGSPDAELSNALAFITTSYLSGKFIPGRIYQLRFDLEKNA